MGRIRFFLTAIITVCFLGCYNASIDEINRPLGSEIGVTWNLLENFHNDKPQFLSEFILKNNSSKVLENNNWELFFNFVHGRNILEADSSKLIISQINGDFHKIIPAKGFKGLQPGEEVKLKLVASAWEIKESNAPGGLFFIFQENNEKLTPELVTDYKVGAFTSPKQTQRNDKDHSLSNPGFLYKNNLIISELPDPSFGKIVPQPLKEEYFQGFFQINSNTLLDYPIDLEKEGQYLEETLEELTGEKLQRSEEGQQITGIKLQLGKLDFSNSPEAYVLEVSKNGGITIKGNAQAGVFYGIQSLKSIIPIEAYQNPMQSIEVPLAKIQDEPRFSYRGMMLDVARNFQSKESVKKLIDLLAFYKINKFHFHLTEDEGWRLEIKGLPELTDFGGKRGYSEGETKGLYPGFGSGPFFNALPGSGFYTVEDFVEILKYADNRHIEVIPEIELPGHARAPVRSMEIRYENYKKEGKLAKAEEFLLSDLSDASQYSSVQVYSDNVICPCQESTYEFIDHVVEQIILMYQKAGVELKNLHMGGDELPKGVWEQSPKCKELLSKNENLNNVSDLNVYFYKNVSKILGKYKLKMGVWEDALEEKLTGEETGKILPRKDLVQYGVTGYSWNNFWGGGNEDYAYKLANLGFPMVLCGVTNLYFDMAYSNDPREPGFYWGGFNDTRKAYEFVPLEIFNSAYIDMFGSPIDPSIANNKEKLTEKGVKNIIGIQGNLFAETVKSRDRMEYMSFPKVLGLAERAWAKKPAWASIKNQQERKTKLDVEWNKFANLIGKREFYRLNYMAGGVNFRIPPAGAKLEDGKLYANTAFPFLTIRYTTDGSEPDKDAKIYTGPVEVTGTIKLKTFDKIGRSSITSTITGSSEPI